MARVYLAGFGGCLKGDTDLYSLRGWAMKIYLCQGTAPNFDRLDPTMFDVVCVARGVLVETLREELAKTGVRVSANWIANEARLYLSGDFDRDHNGAAKQVVQMVERWRAELAALLFERYQREPSQEELEALVKIFLCSTHSNDAAPLETQRNGSLGQLGRLGEFMKLFLCTWPHGAGGDPRDISKSMKLFLSTGRDYGDVPRLGEAAKVSPFKRPIRLLLSYHYYKQNNLDELLRECFDGVPIDIFADSGAYSAASLGETVDPQEYIKWVEKWQHHFSAVSAPDVIGDPIASTRETEVMLKAGLQVKVLPVFHVGEDWKWLRYWNDRTEIDYMALGGMVPHAKNSKLIDAWLSRCFKILRPDLRVHGFGMTSWPALKKWPWFSVDSSSWTAGFRYARLKLFDNKRGDMMDVNMRDNKDLLVNGELIRGYGLAAKELISQTYDRDVLCGVCVESWQRAEAWLEQARITHAQKGSQP